MIMIATYDLQIKEEQLHEETVLSRVPTNLLYKASHLTAFCAWDSIPHLLVIPEQLMRPYTLNNQWTTSSKK